MTNREALNKLELLREMINNTIIVESDKIESGLVIPDYVVSDCCNTIRAIADLVSKD